MNSVHALLGKHHHLLAWLLLAVLLVMTVTLPPLLRHSNINTSILALLPDKAGSSAPQALRNVMMERLDRRLVWLVRPPETDDAAAAAMAWVDTLSHQPLITRISGRLTGNDTGSLLAAIQPHLPALLDAQTLDRLASGADAYARWVMAQLYSPVAGVTGSELTRDPLLLMRSLQTGAGGGTFSLQDGWPVVSDDSGRLWYIVQAELDSSAYDISRAREVSTFLSEAEQQWRNDWPEGELLSQGTLYYSNFASQQAQRDMQILGSLTVVALLILILVTFRSLLPLGACLLSITAGILSGVWSVLVIFSELHLITLIMSISVIGITIDYVLYFLVERRIHGSQRSPQESLRITLPTLLSALLTTLIAYLVLAIPPLSVFRQLMVFSVSGMLAAFLVVLLWVPRFTARLPVRPLPMGRGAQRWLALWQRPLLRVSIPGLLLVLSLLGLMRTQISDDPTDFQALPADILQQEQRLADLLGQPTDQSWLLVHASDPQQALQRLESTIPGLDQAVDEGLLTAYRPLPLASLQTQQQRLELLADIRPQVVDRLREQSLVGDVPPAHWQLLSIADWRASPAGLLWEDLLLNPADSPRAGVIVPMEGVRDLPALREQLAGEGIAVIDRRTDFMTVFADYRRMLSGLLLLALCLVSGYFLLSRGLRQGGRCALPTVISLLAAPATLHLAGYSFNLFGVLAMILVLGVGINYTLFFSNARIDSATTLFVTLLAAATSLLTLGILVFSSTPAISSFGLVLATGLVVACLLAPLAAPRQRGEPA